MPELEDELMIQDWLSILTFDTYKYVKAGGKVQAEWDADGLTLRFLGVAPDDEGVNAKFRRHIIAHPPTPEVAQP
jgi:hypothetical protein